MNNDLAMQTRCVHCGKEQYAPAVIHVSNGEGQCCWCGEYSTKMTVDEYYAAHRRRKDKLRLNTPPEQTQPPESRQTD